MFIFRVSGARQLDDQGGSEFWCGPLPFVKYRGEDRSPERPAAEVVRWYVGQSYRQMIAVVRVDLVEFMTISEDHRVLNARHRGPSLLPREGVDHVATISRPICSSRSRYSKVFHRVVCRLLVYLRHACVTHEREFPTAGEVCYGARNTEIFVVGRRLGVLRAKVEIRHFPLFRFSYRSATGVARACREVQVHAIRGRYRPIHDRLRLPEVRLPTIGQVRFFLNRYPNYGDRPSAIFRGWVGHLSLDHMAESGSNR